MTVSGGGRGGEEVFLFLAVYARSRVLADVFEKERKEKKNKVFVQATETCVWSINKQNLFTSVHCKPPLCMVREDKTTISTFHKTVFVVRITVLIYL